MVVSEAPPILSGMARTVEQLSLRLRARGHEIDVVSHAEVPRASIGEIRLSGLLFRLPGLASRIGGYDVVHLHGATPTFSDVFLLFARCLGDRPPLVYTHHCHVEVGPRPLRAVYRRMHQLLSSNADEVVTTSHDYASELGEENTSVIPLGVDLGQFASRAPKDRGFTVLFVGQFRPYKGVPVLLRAMQQVHGARLLIAGRGPEEELYRRLAEPMGDAVEFPIGVDDRQIKALYERAHAVVLPSVTRAEAFGLVLLEGMAAGCVPIASHLPGVRSVLGRVGFGVPIGSVRSLAATLRALRDNPGLVERIAERGRRRAREFDWDRTVDEHERLFHDLVAVRELQTRLVGTEEIGPALDRFAAAAAAALNVERAAIVIPCGDDLAVAAGSPDGVVGRTEGMLARYCLETGEPATTAPARGRRTAAASPGRGGRPTLAVPLVSDGRPFAAILAARRQPFDQAAVDGALRLARHAGPVVAVALRRLGPPVLATAPPLRNAPPALTA
jgi:rhamnosyl/mannosyltransferase